MVRSEGGRSGGGEEWEWEEWRWLGVEVVRSEDGEE